MCRRAFTLVEVLAVVLLLGLLAAGAAWSAADQVHHRSWNDMLDQIAHEDRLARATARRLPATVHLHIDLDEQEIRRTVQHDGRRLTHVLRIPPPYRCERIFTAGPASGQLTGPIFRQGGVTEIAYSSQGLSASYALYVTAPGDDQAHWLVFAGLTGQMTVMNDDQELENLFTRASGPDPR